LTDVSPLGEEKKGVMIPGGKKRFGNREGGQRSGGGEKTQKSFAHLQKKERKSQPYQQPLPGGGKKGHSPEIQTSQGGGKKRVPPSLEGRKCGNLKKGGGEREKETPSSKKEDHQKKKHVNAKKLPEGEEKKKRGNKPEGVAFQQSGQGKTFTRKSSKGEKKARTRRKKRRPDKREGIRLARGKKKGLEEGGRTKKYSNLKGGLVRFVKEQRRGTNNSFLKNHLSLPKAWILPSSQGKINSSPLRGGGPSSLRALFSEKRGGSSLPMLETSLLHGPQPERRGGIKYKHRLGDWKRCNPTLDEKDTEPRCSGRGEGKGGGRRYASPRTDLNKFYERRRKIPKGRGGGEEKKGKC